LSTMVGLGDPEKVAVESVNQPTPQAGKSEAPPAESIGEPGVQPAFQAYLQARKRLADAFSGRARRDLEAYEAAERRHQAYQASIERAIKTREEDEREALALYRQTVEKAFERAAEAYRDRMSLVLRRCQQSVEQGWISSVDTSAEATKVLLADDTGPVAQHRPDVDEGPVAHRADMLMKLMELRRSALALFRRVAQRARLPRVRMARRSGASMFSKTG
jgi:hypothetical protein